MSHTPKGSMCAACTKANDNCSDLPFSDMRVIEKPTPDIKVVRCTHFESTTERCANTDDMFGGGDEN
ncbi:hypothetical protein [Neptunomonas japonica]|uniref:Uncharacterized protein n=1 Tax=Neptunomonas japonica JAMM 1380 TaxID=1441457 RepID=A0A7R6SW34_9GAMM|nr:hypothetical protein [Neptunomonas japonica]BBB29340.1 conserved hypothetical protein [Neptunomonas japonica JAMM 1380]